MISYYGDKKYKSRDELLSALNQAEVISVDTESDDDIFLGVAIAWSPTEALFVSSVDLSSVINTLSKLPCIMHNATYDSNIFHKLPPYYIQTKCRWDSMLMAQACGYPAALKDLSYEFNFDHKLITSLLYSDAGVKIKGKTLSDCNINDVALICCQHAIGAYKIWLALKDKAPKSYELDMELMPTIMAMHDRGIRVNPILAKEKAVKLEEDIADIKKQCEVMGFNPASPRQIGIALSEEGISLGFNRKSGMMKTDEEALMSIYDRSRIPSMVLKYREISKIYSTYVKPLINIDRIYPKYHIVSTGRFASSPNVQNIPKSLRDLYLPDKGDFFWSIDAHQIEPRIMAWLSQDPQMLNDVLTGDIYTPIAERYHIARYTAKQLVLASSYGAGATKLVETSRRRGDVISLEEAEELLVAYFKTYARYAEWKEETERQAEADGYTTTIYGRVRTLEGMLQGEEIDYNPLLKVVNTKVQGSAADILKLAMLRFQEEKISTTIHDEILISTNETIHIDRLDGLCDIPLSWKCKTGSNWGEIE